MKKFYLFCILICCQLIFSQPLKFYEGLSPAQDYFDLSVSRLDYYQKVKAKLFEDIEDHCKIRLLVTPAFKPEYLFQISEIRKNYELEKYVVQFHIVNKNIHYAKNQKSVNTSKFKANINVDDVELLSNAFNIVVDKKRYERSDFDIYDGVNYTFGVWEAGLKNGIVNSPKLYEQTLLIEVVDDLIYQIKRKFNVSIKPEHKELLRQLIESNNQTVKSNVLIFATEIFKLIEENEPIYNSKLQNESSKKYVSDVLLDLKKTILKQITYNHFNKSTLVDYLNSANESFINQNKYNESDVNYIIEDENVLNNNLFIKIIEIVNKTED